MLDVGVRDVSAKMGPDTPLTEESWGEHEVCSGFQQTLFPHCALVVTKEPECEDNPRIFLAPATITHSFMHCSFSDLQKH